MRTVQVARVFFQHSVDTPLERSVLGSSAGNELSIRPARMSDLEPMLELQAQAFADKFRAAFGQRKIAQGIAAFRRVHQLQGPASLAGMLVAVSEAQIVGTITMRTAEMRHEDSGLVEQAFLRELGTWGTLRALHALSQLDHRISRQEGYITDVAVAEGWRRRGIAQRMVRYVAELARQQGKTRLSLYVSASNHGALELYEGLGFREQLVRSSWWNRLMLGERRWVFMVCQLAFAATPDGR